MVGINICIAWFSAATRTGRSFMSTIKFSRFLSTIIAVCPHSVSIRWVLKGY